MLVVAESTEKTLQDFEERPLGCDLYCLLQHCRSLGRCPERNTSTLWEGEGANYLLQRPMVRGEVAPKKIDLSWDKKHMRYKWLGIKICIQISQPILQTKIESKRSTNSEVTIVFGGLQRCRSFHVCFGGWQMNLAVMVNSSLFCGCLYARLGSCLATS